MVFTRIPPLSRLALFCGIGCIATSPAGAQGAPAPRALKETLRIVDTSESWTRITGLAESRGGVLAVAFTRESRIRFFSPSGAPVGAFGQKGDGPGDFRGMTPLAWSGDTLVVTDEILSRITLLGPTRRLIATRPYNEQRRREDRDSTFMDDFPGPRPLNTGTAGPGLLVAMPLHRTGPARESDAVIVRGKTLGSGRVLFWTPRDDCYVNFQVRPGSQDKAPIPFCQSYEMAAHPVRNEVTLARLLTPRTPGTTFQLTTIRATGDAVLNRSVPYTPVPVSADTTAKWLTLLSKAGPSSGYHEGSGPAMVTAVKAAGIPRSYPPILRLLVDETGNLWLELHHTGRGHLWEIRTANGDLLERVTVPARIALMSITGRSAWGITKDMDDVESIVRFAVR